MDVKHKRVYGHVKITGVKEPISIDAGGIAQTLSQIMRLLFDSKQSMRGDIEIILSLTPRKPDSDLTPAERASREFIAQHSDIIQQASPFDEALERDSLLLDYWTMCLTQNNFDAAVKAGRVLLLIEHVESLYRDSPFWANELLVSRENLQIFGAAQLTNTNQTLFSDRNDS